VDKRGAQTRNAVEVEARVICAGLLPLPLVGRGETCVRSIAAAEEKKEKQRNSEDPVGDDKMREETSPRM